jgi:hypothetical protein
VHSRPPPQTRHPPASRPIPPQASCADGCADGCAVGARRSSGEGGNRPHSTRTVTGALAARLVVHRCTRGSKWGAPHARAAAASDSAKCARARSAVPRAAMGGQARVARKRTCRATHCKFALPPTQPKVGFGVAGRAGEGRGASPRRARRSARWCQCLHELVRLTELIGGLFAAARCRAHVVGCASSMPSDPH